MSLIPFFFGFILGLFPVLLLLKWTRGKFLVITNAYFAGVLYGFWLWVLLMLLIYLDIRFELIGYTNSEQGIGLVAVATASIRGFLIGGLAAALVWKKVYRN